MWQGGRGHGPGWVNAGTNTASQTLPGGRCHGARAGLARAVHHAPHLLQGVARGQRAPLPVPGTGRAAARGRGRDSLNSCRGTGSGCALQGASSHVPRDTPPQQRLGAGRVTTLALVKTSKSATPGSAKTDEMTTTIPHCQHQRGDGAACQEGDLHPAGHREPARPIAALQGEHNMQGTTTSLRVCAGPTEDLAEQWEPLEFVTALCTVYMAINSH